MNPEGLDTPALVLALVAPRRNLRFMKTAAERHPGVSLRDHMKTAKCLEVAGLAAPAGAPLGQADQLEPERLNGTKAASRAGLCRLSDRSKESPCDARLER